MAIECVGVFSLASRFIRCIAVLVMIAAVTCCAAETADASSEQSYKEWVRSSFVVHDFEFYGPIYPYVAPHTNCVLSLATDERGLWAGTTNGILRLDLGTGQISKAVYAQELLAANYKKYVEGIKSQPAPAGWLFSNLYHHMRISDIKELPTGQVWARASMGAFVLASDGRVLADYSDNFAAAQALHSDNNFPGLLHWLYPVDEAGRVYVHWENSHMLAVYDGKIWTKWRRPQVLAGPEYGPRDVAQAGEHVLVASDDYMFDGATGLVAFPFVEGSLVCPFEDGVYLAMPVPIVAATTEEFREALEQQRFGLAKWKWGVPTWWWDYHASLPYPPPVTHCQLRVVRTGDGKLYAAFLRAPGVLRVCVLEEPPSSREVNLGEKLAIADDKSLTIGALYAAHDAVWVSVGSTAMELKDGGVAQKVALQPPANLVAAYPSKSGPEIAAIAQTPDGVMWFGTLGYGIASYDGKEVKWHVTDDPPFRPEPE